MSAIFYTIEDLEHYPEIVEYLSQMMIKLDGFVKSSKIKLPNQFWIAGSIWNKSVSAQDIDIFTLDKDWVARGNTLERGDCYTWTKVDEQFESSLPVQIIRKDPDKIPTIQALLEDFDFSHGQCACEWIKDGDTWKMGSPICTLNFCLSVDTNETSWTNPEGREVMPSLMRLVSFYKREMMSSLRMRTTVMKMIMQMLNHPEHERDYVGALRTQSGWESDSEEFSGLEGFFTMLSQKFGEVYSAKQKLASEQPPEAMDFNKLLQPSPPNANS